MPVQRPPEAAKAPAPEPKYRRSERQALGLAALVFVALVVGLFFIDVVKENLGLEERAVALGATFSKPYAESFGLDWKETYQAVLDDLGVQRLRLIAYWNEIEPEPGVYNFANLDWQIAEASKRDATVILAIGRKVPRWPECHAPAWTEGMNESLVQTRILTMLEKVVRRYADQKTVVAWQVENEPLFEFGECPPPDRDFLKREVAVVRALDKRPVMITESGELSTWIGSAGIADIIGVSTYRTVWNRRFGYFYWPITPKYYLRKYAAVVTFVDKIIISELQAEPWSPDLPLGDLPIEEQLRLMNPERLKDNVRFARRVGFPEAYLWGVEWWYWLKNSGSPEIWEEGQRLFRSQ